MAEIQVTQIDEKPYKTDQNMVDNISLQKTTPKDKILDKFYDEIGYSRFHLIQISLIYILNVSIGSETIFLNVIQLQIINEWSLEIHQMAMLASFFSFGIALGGYFAGYFADNFGRRKALLHTNLFLFFLEFSSTFFDHFIVFLIIMTMISFLVGITTMSCMSYLIEWLPIKHRSMILSYSQLYPLGMILLNSFALIAIEDNQMIYWRWLQRGVSFVNLACFFILMVFCYESPKFFISRQKFDKAFYILDKIGKKAKVSLSERDKQQIMEHASTEESHKIKTSFKELFSGVFLRITLVIISYRMFSSLLNYGSLFILPILLGDSSSQNMYDATLGFLYTNLISLPSPFLRGIFTEIKFLSRKYTILLCSIMALIGYVTSLYAYEYLMFSVGFSRLFMNIATGTLTIYVTEAFPTKIRTMAQGVITGTTRIGAISSPYICSFLVDIDPYACFYCFIIVSVFCGLLCLLLPIDTAGMSLDNMHELKYKMKMEDIFRSKSKKEDTDDV